MSSRTMRGKVRSCSTDSFPNRGSDVSWTNSSVLLFLSLSFPSNHPFRLILATLEKSLRNLVLLNDVDVRTPTGQGISVDGVQQGLGDGLEQLLGAL